jgi:hypothetical protein
MAGIGCHFYGFQVSGGGFDLLDDDRTPIVDNAIDAAADHQDQIRRFDVHGNRHLGTVPLRPLPLDFLVGTNAFKGSPGCGKAHVQVAGAEHNVHQCSNSDLMSFLQPCILLCIGSPGSPCQWRKRALM